MTDDKLQLLISVPKWARWLAQDANGTWWIFDEAPRIAHECWVRTSNKIARKVYTSDPNPYWKDTLVCLR